MLEGNRRVVTLRALENPDQFAEVLERSVLAELTRLSKEYRKSPIEEIQCVVMDAEAARHWIELRHTGENQGAGIVKWEADDINRFRARVGAIPAYVQALDFLEGQGLLDQDQRRNVTTFQRLFDSPAVRAKCGYDVQKGKFLLLADKKKVAKVLHHIMKEVATGKVKAHDLSRKEQRERYAEELPAELVVTRTREPGEGIEPSAGVPAPKKRRKPPASSRPKPREHMIPYDCVMNVTDARVRRIETELRWLTLDNYPNAVSVLFRVFLELSVDAYIDARKLTTCSINSSFFEKVQGVLTDLLARQKMTPQQAAPVRKALQRNSLLAPSIDLMHAYVHNRHIFPDAGELRTSWDNLQPFAIAVWSA